MSSSSGSLVERSSRGCPDDSSRAYAMLASNQARAGPGGGRTTNAGGNAFRAGSNSGSSEYRQPQMMSVRDPPSPWRTIGISVHGGGATTLMMETGSTGSTPPITNTSPYGSTITS